MQKTLTLFLLFVFCINFAFSQTQENTDVAKLKYSFAEFRDASAWRGRYGLTLFSSDGKLLAISGKSVDVLIYETESGNIKSKIDGSGFIAFSFSPDSKFVVAQEKDDFGLKIFETETGKLVREIRGLDKVSNLNKSMNGPGIFSMLSPGSNSIPLEMHGVPISSDWKNILINKNDKEYAIFDFETGNFKSELQHDNYNRSWEVTKLIFAGLVTASTGVPTMFLLLGSTSASQFSSDGKFVIISNGNKTPTLWNVETGKLAAKFESKDRIYIAQFSPDGKMVATSDIIGITRIWDTETGKEISSIGSKKDKHFISNWTKDSEKFFSVGFDKHDVKVIDAKSGKALLSFENSNSYAVIPSHDNKYIATVPRKGKSIFFQIWEADTGKLMATIPRPKNKKPVFALKWNPNNQMIVSIVGLKNEVELWNLKGDHLQTLKNATFPTQFSDDGKLLLTGGKTFDGNNQKDMGYLWEISGN